MVLVQELCAARVLGCRNGLTVSWKRMRFLVPIAQRDRKEESGLGIAQPELVYQYYAEVVSQIKK